jgi:hypothetical protein
MTIVAAEDRVHRRIVVDLSGPEGNAFCLLGMGRRWARQLGKDWEPIQAEATSGDYETLLGVMDREFGALVDFQR